MVMATLLVFGAVGAASGAYLSVMKYRETGAVELCGVSDSKDEDGGAPVFMRARLLRH